MHINIFDNIERLLSNRILSENKVRIINHLLFAVILKLNSKYSDAAVQFSIISDRSPNDPMWRYQCIKCRYKAKQYNEVYILCNNFLSTSYGKEYELLTKRLIINIYWYAGFASALLKKYKNAIPYLKNYLSLKKPKKLKSYVFEWLGYCYLQLDELKLAYEYYNEALIKDPRNASIIANLKYLKKTFDENKYDR